RRAGVRRHPGRAGHPLDHRWGRGAVGDRYTWRRFPYAKEGPRGLIGGPSPDTTHHPRTAPRRATGPERAARGADPGAAQGAGHAGAVWLDAEVRAPADVPGSGAGGVRPRWGEVGGDRGRWQPQREPRFQDPAVGARLI